MSTLESRLAAKAEHFATVGHVVDSSDSEVLMSIHGTGNAAHATLATRIAGERQEDSTTGTDHVVVAGEWAISAAIAAGTGLSVYALPAILGGIWIETTIGTAAPTITDNGTTRMSIPLALPIGYHALPGIIFETDLVVVAGASATGSFRILYRPLDLAVTWAYA